MLITLDAKPQEWMEGKASTIHTVSACSFQNIEHAEYWINKLIPRDVNGNLLKWASARDRKRKDKSRSTFIENCIRYKSEMDFSIDVISSAEGQMSWFAWAFYFQNRNDVSQRIDAKGRNCLVFSNIGVEEISFPVLRAGYLIWYHNCVRYLSEYKNIHGKFLSDNFCNDELGPGEGKAQGVAFVNLLLKLSRNKPQVSLPINEQFSKLDLVSDAFCGWINTVKSDPLNKEYSEKFDTFQSENSKIDSFEFATSIVVRDEHGDDVTALIIEAVANGSANI